MQTFLESLAKAYAHQYRGTLSEVCFVFPGKRAGSFFLHSLRRELGDRVEILPQVTSISDFVETLSGRVVSSHIDQVCMLYDLYRRDRKEHEDVGFDKFQTWADTILADFNDVEMYRVNAEALFRNVRQLKNIRSNYLTEEQMKVMHDYFGFSEFYNADDRHLWQHYQNDQPMQKRFLTLFDSLGKLYTDFCSALEERGLTFSGRSYSQALEALGNDAAAALPYERIVMAGFNALTTVEFMIFKTLAKAKTTLTDGSTQPLGDFYWDCTGVPLRFADNIGRHFVERNQRHFHSIFDLSLSDCHTLPQRIESIAAPSGVAQAKIAGAILDDILLRRHREGLEPKSEDDAEIAVVLPDENLLLPVLYSLPQRLKEVNLTMGYPFSMTAVATFVELLERYQINLRVQDNVWQARTADVDALLSNPMASLILTPTLCHELSVKLMERRRTSVAAEEIAGLNEGCRLLFTPLGLKSTSDRAMSWLAKVLDRLDRAMEEADGGLLHARKLDHSHVLLYINALRRLREAFGRYHIGASSRTAFKLARRLLASEMVRFEGEPLRGVQVMGPLETRSLDFQYLIIPSMNERVYPRRLHQRSFIPAVVRRGFGMATQHFQEAIFTYYFYRMISRAREVYLIYDSRTEDIHSGSPSRFILQLQHLYAKGAVSSKRYRFDLDLNRRQEVSVAKTPEIMELIQAYFTPGSGKHFSASSLNTLIDCPLRFYLQHLRGINKELKLTQGMQGNDMGSIVHQALEDVYTTMSSSRPPFKVDSQTLLQKAADTRSLERLVIAAINKQYYDRKEQPDAEPDADIELFVPQLTNEVRNVLRFDAYRCRESPLLLLSAEKSEKVRLPLPSGLTPNFLYIIDRVDRTADDAPLRIVDYKTGSYEIKAESMAEIFASGHPHALTQLLLYAILYKEHTGTELPVSTVIYDVARMAILSDPKTVVYPTIGTAKVETVEPFAPDFLNGVDEVLTKLQDADQPFNQAPRDSGACRYCPFAESVCGIVNIQE